MSLSTKPYKGSRDFYPEDKIKQRYMFETMSKVAQKFGYKEYDAPILEPTELYTSKGNQEIINEQTYTFGDRAGRSVTIRTEMTPTVSRMVAARRQELSYPQRLFSIPNFWRYERPQKGRLREFWQFNADLFGVAGIEADIEMINLCASIFDAFGAPKGSYTISYSSRNLVNLILSTAGLNHDQQAAVVRLVDRKKRLIRPNFKLRLSPSVRRRQTILQKSLRTMT